MKPKGCGEANKVQIVSKKKCQLYRIEEEKIWMFVNRDQRQPEHVDAFISTEGFL